MANFFAELKRRHIYRVAAAYAVVAWLLLQIVNNVTPIIAAPAWVAQSFLLLLVLGFPIAFFFAWMRELPPSDAAAPVRRSALAVRRCDPASARSAASSRSCPRPQGRPAPSAPSFASTAPAHDALGRLPFFS